MRRRTALALLAAAATGLAGCADDGPSTGPSNRSSPDRTPTAPPTPTPSTTAAGDLSIRNEDDDEHVVTVAVERDGERLVEATTAVGAGPGYGTSGARDVVDRPGTYRVTATTESGTRATREWTVGTATTDLVVVVEAGGGLAVRRRVRCDPACPPVSAGGTAADLPYAAAGAPETVRPAPVHVRNGSDRATSVTVAVDHGDRRVLRYTYETTPGLTVVVPGVVATEGVYDVTVTAGDGRRATDRWDVAGAWPRLVVRVAGTGDLLVGCGEGGGSVTVRNPGTERRSVTLVVTDGDRVVGERSVDAPPGTTAVGGLVPVGGEYRLRARRPSGAADAVDWLVCYCRRDEVTVQLGEDGVSLSTTRTVCV